MIQKLYVGPFKAVLFVCLAGVLTARASGQVVVDFEVNPFTNGWVGFAGIGAGDWTTDQAFSPTSSIQVNDGGYWFGPILSSQPFNFYQMTFKSLTTNGSGGYGTPDTNRPQYATGSGWQDNTFAFRSNYNSPYVQPAFYAPAAGTAYIDDLRLEAISRTQAAAVLDEFHAGMHPFEFTVDPNRHQHLKGVISKLNNNQNVRAVMLGDSIVADSSQSFFEPLVDRMYPGSQIDVIPSVRGSTGCWWYQQTEPSTGIPRVQSYVLHHNPDVVMIGGISHNNDINAVESVIDQIHAFNPNIEIILMSEAAGYAQPSSPIGLVDPEGTEWRSRLYRLADEKNVEFLDLWHNWVNYVVESGDTYQDYFRDSIHMNHAGTQIVGQTIEAYFRGGLYGDTDRDGDVDLSDLSRLTEKYGQMTGATWQDGDFDRDGDVDLIDLSLLAAKYGQGEAQAYADFQALVVPEPGSLSIIMAGAAMALRRRRASRA